MSPSWRTIFYTILVSLLIGAASGVLGTALTSSYLSDYAVELSRITAPLRLSQERPRVFPSSYREAVDRFVESSLPSVVSVYVGAPGALGFTDDDRLGVGLVLTNDGWVAVRVSDAGPFTLLGAHIQVRGQVYPVLESVYDSVSGVVLAKVDASGLPVATFGKGRETQIGEQLFVASSSSAFVTATLSSHLWPGSELVLSDRPNRSLRIDRSVQVGEVVFNLNGEAVGVATEADGNISPIEALLPALRSLLENGKITRASLGVRYVDLTHAVDVPESLSRSHRSGALLHGTSAVPRASAAYRAGLRAGDVVLSVNGETVNGTYGLDELIAQYRPGDRVQFSLDRAGERMTIEVELGERKE